jgi:uncharacterized protein
MNDNDPPRPSLVGPGLMVLALGIVLAGWLVGSGISSVRTADRFVSVKGVAEREVRADLAIWPIQFAVTDDNIPAAQARVTANVIKIAAFLSENGIDSSEVELTSLRVTDVLANPYNPPNRVGNRYIIEQTVLVRTTRPDLVQAASRRVGELVNAGIPLSSGQYGATGPTYVFRKLNDLKPSMIAEATAEARKAAEQFAKDSKSRLGGIHRANQGVFVILPRDASDTQGGPGMGEQGQMYKLVRVVTTVEYLLRG